MGAGGNKSLFFVFSLFEESTRKPENLLPVTWCGHVKLSRRGTPGGSLLSWHSSAQTITFKLLRPAPARLCDSPLAHPTIWPFSSLNVSASFKHVALPSQPSFLSSHYRLLSLGQAELKGGERVCVKWDLYCSPSSNTLSLEWAGNNPWGLVQSNCNPQHIPLAGSPLHCCSGAGAGGARTCTRRLPFPLIC